MPDRNPIACSLSSGDLQRRLGEIARLGAESLVAHELEGDRHVLRFRESAETRQRLEAIVAAEAECCPFLDMHLREEAGAVVLEIRATQEAAPMVAELVSAFR